MHLVPNWPKEVTKSLLIAFVSAGIVLFLVSLNEKHAQNIQRDPNAAQLADMLLEERKGYEAYLAGVEATANPYEHDKYRVRWLDGWMHAKRKVRDDNNR